MPSLAPVKFSSAQLDVIRKLLDNAPVVDVVNVNVDLKHDPARIADAVRRISERTGRR